MSAKSQNEFIKEVDEFNLTFDIQIYGDLASEASRCKVTKEYQCHNIFTFLKNLLTQHRTKQ